ncbi:MAG: hypothetical protein KIT81_12400 [Alphaproteobacteria bacterium]|nr:hypothetical protein [Alphaproteobacteria bacterium]
MEGKIFRGGQAGRGGGAGQGGIEDRVLQGRGGGGTHPAWAGGGVPETVELGRLNMARSPDNVLSRALTEIYATNLDKNGDGTLDADATPLAIDSPMQNLALYKEAIGSQRKVGGNWTLAEAAWFLGKAADKGIPITEDTVKAMSVILEATPDFSAFSYDRAAAHPSDLGRVFGGVGYIGTGPGAFAQAADDARAIVSYHHDNPE